MRCPAARAVLLRHRVLASADGRLARGLVARAVGRDWKGRLSPLAYLVAIPLAYVHPWIADGLYTAVALLWLVPDRRIERILTEG